MTLGLTSVVIPTYQHAEFVCDAVESALAQTAPVEVIVVDDGSTDHTAAMLSRFVGRIRYVVQQHAGPAAARNRGLDEAVGEFVQFLDADDVLEPTKVEEQRHALAEHPEAGWCTCDVVLEDHFGARHSVLASKRYAYGTRKPDGWLAGPLARCNFIPVHSPLIRAEAIGDLRFENAPLEDWHFWQGLAAKARAVYLPRVLASYKRRKNGRNSISALIAKRFPQAVPPLRLNLGAGAFPLDGFVNLDRETGWTFQQGLRQFPNHCVAGVTISHALMYVPLDDWPVIFQEIARVLDDDGVVRITEDDSKNPASSRHGGWKGSQPAITLADAALVTEYLERAGLEAHLVSESQTRFVDGSLRQARHGAPPDVFFLEGIRGRPLLLSPHNDDEALFAAYTILRYKPRVVVCFPSTGDYGDPRIRALETRRALNVLGASGFEQWPGIELHEHMRALDESYRPTRVFAPHEQASHPDHRAVAEAARDTWGDRVVPYHTYDETGKVRSARRVAFERTWPALKTRALSCYRTQQQHPRARVFFRWDHEEFYGT